MERPGVHAAAGSGIAALGIGVVALAVSQDVAGIWMAAVVVGALLCIVGLGLITGALVAIRQSPDEVPTEMQELPRLNQPSVGNPRTDGITLRYGSGDSVTCSLVSAVFLNPGPDWEFVATVMAVDGAWEAGTDNEPAKGYALGWQGCAKDSCRIRRGLHGTLRIAGVRVVSRGDQKLLQLVPIGPGNQPYNMLETDRDASFVVRVNAEDRGTVMRGKIVIGLREGGRINAGWYPHRDYDLPREPAPP